MIGIYDTHMQFLATSHQDRRNKTRSYGIHKVLIQYAIKINKQLISKQVK